MTGIVASDLTPPASYDVIANNIRLHYLDWGGEDKRAILFLHGGGLNAHTWDAVCLGLRDHYHCIALDQRGHGDSEWSPTMHYDAESYVSDITALVHELGLSQFILIGQSLGGLNGLGYAAAHSETLAGLVVVDVAPEVDPEAGTDIRKFVLETAEMESVDDFVGLAMKFNPLRNEGLLRYSIRFNIRKTPHGKWTRKNDIRPLLLSGEAAPPTGSITWKDVGAITCPTLVLRGELSDILQDEEAERLANELSTGRWVRIEGAGHSIQGDNPGAMLREVLDFFADFGL